MDMIYLVADGCGLIGMGYFLLAEITQLKKIRRKKIIASLSKTTYNQKVLAILFTLVCFGLTGLWLSFAVLVGELVIVVWIKKLIKKCKVK